MQQHHPVKALNMVILMVTDLDASIAFYQDLGFKLVFRLKDTWAEFRIGSVKLGLCPTTHSQEGRRSGLVLEVEDLVGTYEQLKDSVQFLTEPKEAVHGKMITFADPSGNILDFYQPTPEKVVELAKQRAQEEESCAQKAGCCGGGDC
jgi:catechol 2,3-dioxygenase-like lactoylglutathione lyase family enzyme